MTEKIKITINKNGPISIDGYQAIIFCGEKLEKEGKAFICRCGNSKNAPFCDGSHKRTGFDDSNDIQEPQAIKIWQGSSIKTYFNANLCMHARYCKELGNLRKIESADPDVARKIAEIVTQCPSGALSFEMLEGESGVTFASSGTVEIMEGGEVRIQSEIESDSLELQDHQPTNRLALCRCGLSKNKPYCDASHSEKTGFR